MSAAARRKCREAGEKQGHRREAGRTPQNEVQEKKEAPAQDWPDALPEWETSW